MRIMWCLCCLGLLLFGANRVLAEEVTLNKIKVIGNSYTEEKVIRDFMPELSEGQRIEISTLKSILQKFENRLGRTQYFYDISTQIIPSRKEMGKVNLIIEVTEGFLYRFGGGPGYWAMGINNISGQGRDVNVLLGMNVLALQWQDEHLDRGHYFFSGMLGYSPVSYLDRSNTTIWDNKRGIDLFLGKNISPEWRTGLGLEATTLFDEKFRQRVNYLLPSLKTSYVSVDDLFNPSRGVHLELSLGYFTGERLRRGALDLRYYRDVLPAQLIYAGRLNTVVQGGDLGYDYFGCSLAEQNGVRTDLTRDYFGKHVLLLNQEFRYRLNRTALFGFVDCSLEPLIFLDLGKTADSLKVLSERPFSYAYGLGLRLMIGVPVYVPLRLEWGWGSGGSSKATFAMAAPF